MPRSDARRAVRLEMMAAVASERKTGVDRSIKRQANKNKGNDTHNAGMP
jgi:hypothetical protein